MLNVAICEDDLVYSQKLTHMVQTFLTVPFQSTVFLSGNDFLQRCSHGNCPFDIVLMDIDLGSDSITGLTISQKINLMNPDAQIIYISQHLEYVSSVYETQHVYFINKTQVDEFLEKALLSALSNLHDIQQQYLYFERQQKSIKILQKDILYMERILRITEIHTRQTIYSATERLPVLLQQLSPAFVICHRSYLVNLNTVSAITSKAITFFDGNTIPVSRACYPKVKEAFAQLMMSKL